MIRTHTTARFGMAAMAGLLAAGLAPAARAQEAMYTQAATMPSPGTAVIRSQIHFELYGSNPASGVSSTEKIELMNSVAIGLVRDLALNLDLAMEAQRQQDGATGAWSSDKDIDSIDAMLKWRIYQNDPGGIDTERIALLFGAVFDNAQDDDLSGLAVNPHVGAVYTRVKGRHGFNQDLLFRVNTSGDEADNYGGDGPSDMLHANSAYVYRIYPDRFRPDSDGAWYTTLELSAMYETNGDVELRWAPGIMYEGRRFAWEAMVQLPLVNEVDNRAELDVRFGFGIRYTF